MVRHEEFNPQGLANTAWAFATLGVRQEELLGAIAGRALVRVEEFNPEAFAGIVWALSGGGHGSDCVLLLGERCRHRGVSYAIGGILWAPIVACERSRQMAHVLL